MKLLRSCVIAAATGLALAATTTAARANDPGSGCSSCTAGGASYGGHGGHFGGHFGGQPPSTLFGGHGGGGGLFQGRLLSHFQPKQKLPAFQAAPWYNYWPYDGHFLTPAPIAGPFYGPPLTGNFPVNPYFPGPAYPVTGYGHGIPGGPPPVTMPPGR